MDSEFVARIAAPPYYRVIPHLGRESAQFIIDHLLRFSFKRLGYTNDAIHDMRKRIALVDHNLGQLGDDIRISRQSCDEVRAEWLEGAGYRVTKATTPEAAEQVLRAGAVDLAILDIRLRDDDDERDLVALRRLDMSAGLDHIAERGRSDLLHFETDHFGLLTGEVNLIRFSGRMVMIMPSIRRMEVSFFTCRMTVCPVGRVVMVVNIPMVMVVVVIVGVVVIMLVRVAVILIVLI